MTVQIERPGHGLQQPLGQRPRVGVGVGVQPGSHHHEFITTDAGHQVVGAHGGCQPLGQAAQHRVAGVMAMQVVDRLEAVQVDQVDGMGVAGVAAGQQRLGCRLQAAAVEQAGQRVGLGDGGQQVALAHGQLAGHVAGAGA